MRVSSIIVGLACLAASAAHAGAPPELVSSGDFDYYVLTLSWSPGFCDTGGENKSPDQCETGSGQGFVVHGLWPNNLSRSNPEDCGGDSRVSSEALAETRGVYPSAGLAKYEYEKHGACTGLGAENYFAAVKYARDQFTIPDMLKAPRQRVSTSPAEIASAFMAVNANLTAASMAVTCVRGELVDVRFCLSKNLGAFVNCPSVANHTCHSSSISVAPPR